MEDKSSKLASDASQERLNLKHWLAYRNRWGYGPKVITPRDDVDVSTWRRLGYRVEGPFVLEADTGAVDRADALVTAWDAWMADMRGDTDDEAAFRVLKDAVDQLRRGR